MGSDSFEGFGFPMGFRRFRDPEGSSVTENPAQKKASVVRITPI